MRTDMLEGIEFSPARNGNPMSKDGVWQRFRRSRIAGVLAVYAGVAWVVLQLIDVLDGIMTLPDWVGPVALVLLAAGLVLVVATAFVQGAAESPERAATDAVPGAWELDLDQIDDELRAGGLPHLTWARAALGGVVAFSLLFGAAGLVAFFKYRGAVPETTPSLVAAEAPEPGLAVLPFDVRATDPELEVWHEGLVVTVAANLDGVEGLRTIDYGTVLARWAERVPEGSTADLETSLDAARAAGGEWAVRGSLLETGDNVRIDATVRSVSSGDILEQIRVEGPVDSLVSLIDRLSVEILRAVLPERGLEGGVGLESVASSSPEALKAWVEGERDFRRGDFDQADESFLRAIEIDSTFALAWLRLAQSRGWRRNTPGIGSEREAYEKAAALTDRLSPRERMLLRAQGNLVGLDSIGADSLQAFVRQHPDDAEAWAQLGERLYHAGSPDSMRASDEPFAQAIALQPRFVPYHIHAVDLAFQIFADSGLARERVERLEGISPASPQAHLGRVAYDLAFGAVEEQEAALAALPELDLSEHLYLMARFSHPEFFGVAGRVANSAMGRPDFPAEYQDQFRWNGAEAMTEVGRLHEAFNVLKEVRDPNRRFCGAGGRVTVAGVLPEAEYERFFGRDAVYGVLDAAGGPEADSVRVNAIMCARFAARVIGHAEEAAAWAAVADSIVESMPADAQEGARQTISIIDGIGEFYLAYLAGDPETALSLFEASPVSGQLNSDFRRFKGRLMIALDRPAEALEVLGPLGMDPLAAFDRARAYEALGRDAEAREAYEYFLRYWQPDVPELEARVDSATAGLTRIAARLN
jgi:tetratricopeptide (TPR) repeat protein/TolB-like protein